MPLRPSSPILSYDLPYGANLRENGIQFSVVSRSATGMSLLLYDKPEDAVPSRKIPLDPIQNRWGDVWNLFLEDAQPGTLYHFQADGPFQPDQGHRFDSDARLIDPFAKALVGDYLRDADGILTPPKCVVIDDHFDWGEERHPNRDLAESIIYELHVGGFTRSPSSDVQFPGTYRGLMEKIPYLKSLGITTVELMPVHEFPLSVWNPALNLPNNYWGYDPLAFFAPHRGYASSSEPGGQVREFKEMIRAFHNADIEVILDVVFNHTAEGDERGPVLSFKGLENQNYYLLRPDGNYLNFTGCGNTVNGNHPWVRELIFACLRYWVHAYHIDGFRFDLASILSRDRWGNLTANPPVLEMIAEDPLLSGTKIIAEAWDAAGAYQVGSFGSERWAEWNGKYRDDVRSFWQGLPFETPAFATRFAGSSDLYQPSGRGPSRSINFITAHDGFTLNDLVSYNVKHNEANGEENRDGENVNHSLNFGIEGPSSFPEIEGLRNRQIRNFFVTLLMSRGVPMILAGDEIRRTQKGNNNAWCQDNDVSWFDWSLLEREKSLLRFVKTLIDLRRQEPSLTRNQFFTGKPTALDGIPDIAWFAPSGSEIDWGKMTNQLSIFLSGKGEKGEKTGRFHFWIAINGSPAPGEIVFPAFCAFAPWRLFIDTAALPSDDIFPQFDGPSISSNTVLKLPPFSLQVFVSPLNETLSCEKI